MAKEKFLLIDTDILIDYSRGLSSSRDRLLELEASYFLAISVITQFELMVGCESKSDFNALERFLNEFEIIHLNHSISEKTVGLFESYRLSYGVLIPDM